MSVVDISTEAQTLRVLARLKSGPVDTLTLRKAENVMAPAARVMTLRKRGYEIETKLRDKYDDYGRKHPRVAHYRLISEPKVAA